MLGSGYFNPLTGYMNKEDSVSVAEKMQCKNGLFLAGSNRERRRGRFGDSRRQAALRLRDPNVEGNPILAIQDVEAIEEFSDDEMKFMTEKIFRTDDPEHPGVAAFNSVGKTCVSGPIQVLNFSYFDKEFSGHVPHGLPDSRRNGEDGLGESRRFPNAQSHAPRARRIMPDGARSRESGRDFDSHAAR